MATRRRRRRLIMRVEQNVIEAVTAVGISLRGPSVARALHEGATLIANKARQDAPMDTGQLRRGVYTASIIRNEYAPLVRLSNGRRLNSPLKFPPRPNQALVVSSVYYTRFIEKGVKPRAHDPSRSAKHERRGVGRQRRRPFFQPAVRRMRQPAEVAVQRALMKLIQESWER